VSESGKGKREGGGGCSTMCTAVHGCYTLHRLGGFHILAHEGGGGGLGKFHVPVCIHYPNPLAFQ